MRERDPLDAMARDLEAMRIPLGEERISYVGYSYGTVLGAAYARLYPERVDAFVLDSPVHPSLDWLADEEAQIASQEGAGVVTSCQGTPR